MSKRSASARRPSPTSKSRSRRCGRGSTSCARSRSRRRWRVSMRSRRRRRRAGACSRACFSFGFGRGAQQLRLLLDEGKFGRLHLGMAETLWFRDDDYYSSVPWRGKWATEAGGATVSQAIHLIDLLLWYFGEPVSVFADAGVFRTPTESRRCQRRRGAVQERRHRPDHVDGQRLRRGALAGRDSTARELAAVSQGSAYAATSEPFRLSAPDAGCAEEAQRYADERFPSGYRVLHRGAIRDFLDAIRDGRGPLAGIEACRTALQVTAAIYKSAMTGAPVALPITTDRSVLPRTPPRRIRPPFEDGPIDSVVHPGR